MSVGVSWRELWGRGLVLVVLVVVASWPSNAVRAAFAHGFCALMSPALEQTTFEGQAGVEMRPLTSVADLSVARGRNAPGNPTANNIVADTALVLRLNKYAGQMQVELSSRRDVYLPLVIFGSLVVVAPLGWRRRLVTLGVGWAVILLVAIGSIYVLLGNIFSGRLMLAPQLAEVYPVSEVWGSTLQFLNQRWLTPPGNRVIAPFLLALAAIALQIEHLGLKVRPLGVSPALRPEVPPPTELGREVDRPMV